MQHCHQGLTSALSDWGGACTVGCAQPGCQLYITLSQGLYNRYERAAMVLHAYQHSYSVMAGCSTGAPAWRQPAPAWQSSPGAQCLGRLPGAACAPPPTCAPAASRRSPPPRRAPAAPGSRGAAAEGHAGCQLAGCRHQQKHSPRALKPLDKLPSSVSPPLGAQHSTAQRSAAQRSPCTLACLDGPVQDGQHSRGRQRLGGGDLAARRLVADAVQRVRRLQHHQPACM